MSNDAVNLRAVRRGGSLQLGYRWDLSVYEADVPIDGLPASLAGFRILHLSDAHFGTGWHAGYDRAIARINAVDADLIAFTGDWIEDKLDPRAGLPTTIRFARQLRARLGLWSITGNHDGDLVAPRLIEAGLNVLVGERVLFAGGDGGIELVGLPGVGRDDLADALLDTFAPPAPGVVRIVLGHYPDQVRRVARIGAHLLLAGHTHGGQVCLPGGVPILKHDALPRDQVTGLHRLDGTWLHTSRGLGCSTWNIRLFCPPELTTITLQCGSTTT